MEISIHFLALFVSTFDEFFKEQQQKQLAGEKMMHPMEEEENIS